MTEIINQAKILFEKMVDDYGQDPWGLRNHILDLEKRDEKVCKIYPELDKNILLLAVYLHDIGHYPIPEEDHAIVGEKIAKEFLTSKDLDSEFVSKVCHCVRSHRNNDVPPQSLEAKIIACIDSASHFTDNQMYSNIYYNGKFDLLIGKLDRDFRDVSVFPEIQKEVEGLYYAWKNLTEKYLSLKTFTI